MLESLEAKKSGLEQELDQLALSQTKTQEQGLGNDHRASEVAQSYLRGYLTGDVKFRPVCVGITEKGIAEEMGCLRN